MEIKQVEGQLFLHVYHNPIVIIQQFHYLKKKKVNLYQVVYDRTGLWLQSAVVLYWWK